MAHQLGPLRVATLREAVTAYVPPEMRAQKAAIREKVRCLNDG